MYLSSECRGSGSVGRSVGRSSVRAVLVLVPVAAECQPGEARHGRNAAPAGWRQKAGEAARRSRAVSWSIVTLSRAGAAPAARAPARGSAAQRWRRKARREAPIPPRSQGARQAPRSVSATARSAECRRGITRNNAIVCVITINIAVETVTCNDPCAGVASSLPIRYGDKMVTKW